MEIGGNIIYGTRTVQLSTCTPGVGCDQGAGECILSSFGSNAFTSELVSLPAVGDWAWGDTLPWASDGSDVLGLATGTFMLCFAQEGAVPHPGTHYTSFAVLNDSRDGGGRIQLAFVHVDVVPHCHIELGWFSTHEGIETGLLHNDSAIAVCASTLASVTGKYDQHVYENSNTSRARGCFLDGGEWSVNNHAIRHVCVAGSPSPIDTMAILYVSLLHTPHVRLLAVVIDVRCDAVDWYPVAPSICLLPPGAGGRITHSPIWATPYAANTTHVAWGRVR